MKLEVGKPCVYSIDDGVMIDYVEGTWLILIRDEIWQREEIQAFLHNPGLLGFLPLDTVVFFTVRIEDVLETSDLPFMIQQNEQPQLLLQDGAMKVTLALLGRESRVEAVRTLMLNEQQSRQIADSLRRIWQGGYDQQSSDNQIDRTQQRYQPYELDEKAPPHIPF